MNNFQTALVTIVTAAITAIIKIATKSEGG